ncbi:F-box only protein [Dirofilaria immitis]
MNELLPLLRHITYMTSALIKSECTNMAVSVSTTFNTLPVEIITYILNCLSYDDISSLRAVSKSFDVVARSILNNSFFRLFSH